MATEVVASSLVDRVGEAMAGIDLDECDEETAEAWRANARAAILVMRNEDHWELRDELMRILIDEMQSYISADSVTLFDSAVQIADRLLEDCLIVLRPDREQ